MRCLQEIIEIHGENYIRDNKLPANVLKALSSIQY